MRKLKKIYSSDLLGTNEEYTLEDLEKQVQEYIALFPSYFDNREVIKYTFESTTTSMPYENYDYPQFNVHFYVEETKAEETERMEKEESIQKEIKRLQEQMASDEYKQYLELQKKFR